MKRTIYLDYAAATPADSRVIEAMKPFWADHFYNPSATYFSARTAAAQLKDFRRRAALCLGVKPSEIIFTAGGTEADNLAIKGVMDGFPEANLIVSAIEHHAVLVAAQQYQLQLAAVDHQAQVDLAKLANQINDQTVLVSIMQANNEVGAVQSLAQIGQLINKVRTQRAKSGNKLPLYLHSDASQAANYLSIKPNRLAVGLLTVNGGKIYGPKQTGLLYVNSAVELVPQVHGGGQERGLRSGTESLAAVAGLVIALEIAQAAYKTEAQRMRVLQKLFEGKLKEIAEITINSQGRRLPNIVHISIDGVDNETLMMQLDEQGIMCAVGSACSASSDEPSHVLGAMGLSDQQAQSSLRFSMGRATTQKDVLEATQVLTDLLQSQR